MRCRPGTPPLRFFQARVGDEEGRGLRSPACWTFNVVCVGAVTVVSMVAQRNLVFPVGIIRSFIGGASLAYVHFWRRRCRGDSKCRIATGAIGTRASVAALRRTDAG